MRGENAIVVTTIYEPAFLDGYLENIRAFGRKENTNFFIIPDRKTPATIYEAAKNARKNGFVVHCPDLEEQVRFLKKPNLLYNFPLWNTDNLCIIEKSYAIHLVISFS